MKLNNVKAVIFDLDQTLIDSQHVAHLRDTRQWATLRGMTPSIKPFPGIPQLLLDLDAAGIKVAVVTSSPSIYCGPIVTHWGWKIDAVVCWHDTDRHKPYPDPILKALEKLGVSSDVAISVGDLPTDTLAGQRAGVRTVGAMWGTQNITALEQSNPDYICQTVQDLGTLLL